jgi:hypothetical protein
MQSDVTPAKAGVQNLLKRLDSCWSLPRYMIRGRNDGLSGNMRTRFYQKVTPKSGIVFLRHDII